MSVKRDLWNRLTPKESIPGLPCPRCANGKLKLKKDGLTVLTPKYASQDREDWDLYDVVER
jgi:hypothetical protein